ncbi:hypothetical protein PsalN5692_00899 [Piscirickettsia salmonis]|uniref:hypothetical protein n=1 Tax=Piscirickettsia salmonis TaxID=1238 RepID=UPI0012B9FE30|nr:hypothetical protein [Piscirickettsia salmonis]QGP49460.1 hypothetical protein PsalN5692_00899 [Piscirickettsia salmonis]
MPRKQKTNKVKTISNINSKKKETLIENENTNIISDTLISNSNNTNKKFALNKEDMQTYKNEEIIDYDLLKDISIENSKFENDNINIYNKKNNLKKELLIEEHKRQNMIKVVRAKEKTMCINHTLNNLTGDHAHEYAITAFEMATEQYKNRFKPLVENTFGTILTTGGYGLIKGISSYMSEGVTMQVTDISNRAINALGYNNYQQTRKFRFDDYLKLLKNKKITPLQFFMRITSHPSNWNSQSFNGILINSCKLINSCINNGFTISDVHYLRSGFSGFSNEECQNIRESILLNSMSKSKSKLNSNLYSNSQPMLEHQNTINESLKTFNIDNN